MAVGARSGYEPVPDGQGARRRSDVLSPGLGSMDCSGDSAMAVQLALGAGWLASLRIAVIYAFGETRKAV